MWVHKGFAIGPFLFGLVACNAGESGNMPRPTLTATHTLRPTATPTPSATPTSSPATVLTYRLTEGSTIVFMPPTSSAGAIHEPLPGTFDVVRVPSVPPPPTPFEGNAFNLFAVT